MTADWSRELRGSGEAHKCEFLDAPVTGSKAQAASGELNFLVGGSASTLEKAQPVLAAMSKSITPVGPAGSGAMIKLINNFVCGVQIIALAEALTMIERSGLDRTRALEILTQGAPGSPACQSGVRAHGRGRLHAEFSPAIDGEGPELFASGSRETFNAPGHGASGARYFSKAIAAGHGDKDIAAAVEFLRAE